MSDKEVRDGRRIESKLIMFDILVNTEKKNLLNRKNSKTLMQSHNE